MSENEQKAFSKQFWKYPEYSLASRVSVLSKDKTDWSFHPELLCLKSSHDD